MCRQNRKKRKKEIKRGQIRSHLIDLLKSKEKTKTKSISLLLLQCCHNSEKTKKSKANNQNHKNVASFTELTSNVSMLHFCRFLCCCMPSYICNLICKILNHSKLKLKNHKVSLFECFVKHSQGIIFWFFQPHTSTQMINELNYTKQTHTQNTSAFLLTFISIFSCCSINYQTDFDPVQKLLPSTIQPPHT